MELIFNQKTLYEFKTKIKKKFPHLKDDDLKHEEGDEETMLTMIAYKLHKTKQEMQEIIAML